MDESPVQHIENPKSQLEGSAESVKDSAADVKDSAAEFDDFFDLFHHSESPVKEWIILTGSRRIVIGGLMGAVLGLFLVAGFLNPIEVAAQQAGVETSRRCSTRC